MSEQTSSDPTNTKTYAMRLTSRHTGDDNELVSIDCELRRDGEFQPYALSEHNSAFLNFLYSAFTCQLTYLRMNAAERGLALEQVEGQFQVVAESFVLRSIDASFVMELRDGEVEGDDLAYIRERCLACPVSRNLLHVRDKETTVRVASAAPTDRSRQGEGLASTA